MDIVIRAAVTFVALYALLRLMGKRELGQMTPFELVLLVVLGDLVQQGVTHNDFSVTGSILAIATFAFLALLLSWVTYLWPAAARAFDGEPRVLVRNGELVKYNLRRDRITESELAMEMRLAGISTISDVAWAVLEPNGKLSFIRVRDIEAGQTSQRAEPSV